MSNYDPMSPATTAPPAERSSSGECVLPSTYYVKYTTVDILTCQKCYRGKKCPEVLQINYVSLYLRNKKQNPEGRQANLATDRDFSTLVRLKMTSKPWWFQNI